MPSAMESSFSQGTSMWAGGNVVIIRHAWVENRKLNFTDSLSAHLDNILVREGQRVTRGQQIGTIGNNHGMYPPHLHFEMHKDLSIGVNHAQGTRDLRSYWLPTEFIMAHRHLNGGGPAVPVPPANFLLPTLEHPWSFPRFFSHGKKSSHGKGSAHYKSGNHYKTHSIDPVSAKSSKGSTHHSSKSHKKKHNSE